jgi:hypothetical protein
MRHDVHTAALRAVLTGDRRFPATVRALAREAGVPHSTLIRVASGQLGASASVVERVAVAIETWQRSCAVSAAELRRALERASGGRRPRGIQSTVHRRKE